jgi:HK97 family phage major capsid protein
MRLASLPRRYCGRWPVEQLATEVRDRLNALDQRVNNRLGIENASVTGGPDQDKPVFERKLRHGRDGDASQARRPDVLSRDQSVVDWMRSRGQIRDEHAGLSFDRYIRGLVTGDWSQSQPELKIYKHAMSEGIQTAGGHLVPTPLSGRIIDLARNAMRVIQAGATTVPMTSQTLKIARLTGEGTPAWHAENAAITDADLSFDAVTFTARTLTRLVKVSMELFEDADPSSEDVIARSFAAQIALELDRVALRGSGTAPEPRGVLNHTGVTLTDHGANGTAITNYDWWLDAVGAVRNLNWEPTAHIQAPRSSTSLSKLKEATTNAYLRPPDGLLPMLPTKQIPTSLTVGTSNDCSEIYTGDWSQLMIGMRTNFRLKFLDERYIDNGQYAFFAYLRADIQLMHGEAFNVDRGVRG